MLWACSEADAWELQPVVWPGSQLLPPGLSASLPSGDGAQHPATAAGEGPAGTKLTWLDGRMGQNTQLSGQEELEMYSAQFLELNTNKFGS